MILVARTEGGSQAPEATSRGSRSPSSGRGGPLSGTDRRDQLAPEGCRHAIDWDEPRVYDEDKLLDTVDALIEVAEEHGVSAAQVASAWLLRRPAVASLVVGARTEGQLRDSLLRSSCG